MDSSRRLAVVAAAAAVTAAAAGFGVVWLAGSGDDGGSPGPRPSARATQAKVVARALTGLSRDPAALVATASRRLVGGDARRGVPLGARVIPHARSWQPDGYGGGLMEVTVTPPRGDSVRYAAVMVQESGGWKVMATVPVGRSQGEP